MLARTELSDPSADKNTLAPLLETIGLETVASYPQDIIHVYTDGSAHNATTNAGYGAVIKYPNMHPEDHPNIFGPCGDICSNYEAEIIAIDKGTLHI